MKTFAVPNKKNNKSEISSSSNKILSSANCYKSIYIWKPTRQTTKSY